MANINEETSFDEIQKIYLIYNNNLEQVISDYLKEIIESSSPKYDVYESHKLRLKCAINDYFEEVKSMRT
jgi:hypothetical protein